MSKVYPDAKSALDGLLHDNMTIAAGTESLQAALKAIRAVTSATIVLKRGAKGCIVYDGAIPADLEDGIVGKGFPIEIWQRFPRRAAPPKFP